MANDTAAFRSAVDAVAGTGGTLLVPDGTYMIDAIFDWDGGAGGVALKSNMTLWMSSGAVLKAIPNNRDGYGIVTVNNATDVNIVGGTILGERAAHKGTTGQWGTGIDIRSSHNVAVDSVTIKECWGDGLLIYSYNISLDSPRSTNITICNVVADHNRRQGLTIGDVSGLTVRDSTFKNTSGHLPQFGINIEPDLGLEAENITVENNQFLNNASGAISLYGRFAPIKNVTIRGNRAAGNPYALSVAYTGGHTLAGNVLEDAEIGVILSNTQDNDIRDNSILNSYGSGILLGGAEAGGGTADRNRIRNNTVTGSNRTWLPSQIQIDGGSDNEVSGNTCRMNANPTKPAYGIAITTAAGRNNEITDNDLRRSGSAGAISDEGTGTIVSGNIVEE